VIVWRGAVAALGLIAVLIARSRGTGLFDEILGATMIAIALSEQVPRFFGGLSPPWWRSGVIAISGALIFMWPAKTGESVGLFAAFAIAVYGLIKSIQALMTPAGVRRLDRLARGVLMVALAIVVALFPEATVRVVVLAIGVFWIFKAAVVASAIGRSEPTSTRVLDLASTQENLDRWLEQRPMTESARARVDDVLFFDRGDGRRRLFRLGILMGLSTAIATFGIATDSTAVVIGAMLIAPLMTPILATASALLRGWPVRALRSGAVVLASAAGSIILAWLLAAFIPNLTAVTASSEVVSRTAPNILDLAIAVAAGAAGAFAVSRTDVSDTLPGVAVAIALVPPLAVVGVTLYAGNIEQALGALLLFGTNLVAIVAMASIVFVLTGYVAWSQVRVERRRIRASYAAVAAGVVLLLIPLGLTARDLIREASTQRASQKLVDRWLGDTADLRVSELGVAGERVMITLHGSGTPPPSSTLHDAMTTELGDGVILELRVVPEVLDIVDGDRR
jgi:uncharacterized hydrophobic protein (TIGR00271 family)